jgi:hypothetical protein
MPVDNRLVLALRFVSAAEYAAEAVHAAATGDDDKCSQRAYDAYMLTVLQAIESGVPDRESVLNTDYTVLRQAAESGKLKDDSPVWRSFTD